MHDERLVAGVDGWYFRVRGGEQVGPYVHREQAHAAVRAYRDACLARVHGTHPWSLWRRPKFASALHQTLRLDRA